MLRQLSHSEPLWSTYQARMCICRRLLFGNRERLPNWSLHSVDLAQIHVIYCPGSWSSMLTLKSVHDFKMTSSCLLSGTWAC